MICLVPSWPATPQLFPTSLLLPVLQDTQCLCTPGSQEDQDRAGSSLGIPLCIPEDAGSCSDRGRVQFLGETNCGLASTSSCLEGTGQGGRRRQWVREQLLQAGKQEVINFLKINTQSKPTSSEAFCVLFCKDLKLSTSFLSPSLPPSLSLSLSHTHTLFPASSTL